MKWKWIIRQGKKWNVEMPNFTSGRKSLNQFPFQKKNHQEKRQLWWKKNENEKYKKQKIIKNHENKKED